MSDWKQDPRLKNISPEKLQLLEKLASGIHGKSPNEAMPLLMAIKNWWVGYSCGQVVQDLPPRTWLKQ